MAKKKQSTENAPKDSPAAEAVEASAEAPEVKTYEGDYLCPTCGVRVDYRCRKCGATKSVNRVSGNVIWMRNGRIVRAFHDEKRAWTEMAKAYKIPENEWPPQYRS